VPDLGELCQAAVEAAHDGEAVEAYAEESRRTEVEPRRGHVEGLTFAESRGVGVRVIVDGRLGFSYAADPSLDEVRVALDRARENAALATPDEHNVLPQAQAFEPLEGQFDDAQAAMDTDEKVRVALDLERVATSTDERVTKVETCSFGDAIASMAIASTEGVRAEFRRTGTWVVVGALADGDDETQTGFSFQVGRRLADLDPDAIAREAVERAVRMIGASKPPTQRVPVILDPFAASSFLAVLIGALSAEAVLKGRSLFADKLGERVGSEHVTLVDDGRLQVGPAASPFDDEGVPTRRTELVTAGVLNGFLQDTYTAHRSGTTSTGNANRAGYRSTPGVGTSNFWLEPGERSFEQLLADAEGGVLIQDVSGVHSGANPISGEFSVGATGLRISGGALAEPLREMTIASTIPEMLGGVTAVGSDLRFFTSVGTPSILIGEMTVAGV
jgi:PmbA protein